MTDRDIQAIADALADRVEDRIADRVHDRLTNGPIRELQESVKGLDDKVDGLCEMSTKVEDIHGWFQSLNERMSNLETGRD